MNFCHLLPLPQLVSRGPQTARLQLDDLQLSRGIDQIYFKFYGIDFDVPHYFGQIHCQTSSVGNQAYDIATHVFMPKQAQGTLVIIHGLFDHVGLYNHVIQTALDNHLAVVAFDLPGHGLSSGERASIQDFSIYTQVFEQIINLLSDILPQDMHVLAQSTGAAVVIDYLRSSASVFKTHVFFAPLIRPYAWQMLRWPYYALRCFIRQQKRKFRDNTSDAGFLAFLQRDPLQANALKTLWINAMENNMRRVVAMDALHDAVFVIQGDRDHTVDWSFNLAVLKRKLLTMRVLMLAGAEHHLANERVDYRERWRVALIDIWNDVGH